MSSRRALPKYANDLSGFVGDLRSMVFPSQEKAAAHFHIHRSTVTRYESGKHAPPAGYLAALTSLIINHLETMDAQDADVRRQIILQEVNKAMRYSLRDIPFKNWEELRAVADAYLAEQQKNEQIVRTASVNVDSQTSATGEDTNSANKDTGVGSACLRFDMPFFFAALKDWNNDFFKWAEASEHMRSSWAGMVIYGMSAFVERITFRGLLVFSLSLLLGMVAVQLMSPILELPLDNTKARQIAYLKYGLATLFIPLLVSLVTPPDRDNLFQLETPRQRITFWMLKFSGALVGFWVFSILMIAITLVCYYLYLPPLSNWLRGGLALIPLFFSYVATRRIPTDRHKMFKGELKIHPADRFFLAIFVPLGPLVALFLYAFYDFMSSRKIAPLSLTILLTGLALWEYRKRHRNSLSDLSLILITGLVIPGFFLIYGIFVLPNQPPLTLSNIPYLLIFVSYVLGWTLLGATILVRNSPTLTIRGVLTALAIIVAANLITVSNCWLGAGFIFVMILAWFLRGKERFKPYFSIHNAAWVMIVITGISLYLLVSNAIPLWLNILGFVAVSVALIGRAYRVSADNIPSKKSNQNAIAE